MFAGAKVPDCGKFPGWTGPQATAAKAQPAATASSVWILTAT
jgi:hypothetical protein